MSQKVLDRKGKFRNKIISFRVSPEESCKFWLNGAQFPV